MAWSCLQDEQRPASKNSANLDARRKQKKRQPKTTWLLVKFPIQGTQLYLQLYAIEIVKFLYKHVQFET